MGRGGRRRERMKESRMHGMEYKMKREEIGNEVNGIRNQKLLKFVSYKYGGLGGKKKRGVMFV